MQTIKYLVRVSPEDLGDVTGLDVDKSFARYLAELERMLNTDCADLADGYQAEYVVARVDAMADDGVFHVGGPADECWTEHTDIMTMRVPEAINRVWSEYQWAVDADEEV